MRRRGLFLDAGVLIAVVVRDERHHDQAAGVLQSIREGTWSRVVTSDFVVAETLNFLRVKVRRREALEAAMALVVGAPDKGPVVTEFARIHGGRFAAGWDAMRRYHDQGLSFTDCTSLVLARELGLEAIATFDRGFDAFLDVVPGASP